MDFILENFQIVVLIAGALAYFVNNFKQAKEAERQARDQPEIEPEDRFGPDFDFGEIQDSPRQAVPPPMVPPPVKTPATPPPLARSGPRASAQVTHAAGLVQNELDRQRAIQDRLAEIRRGKSEGREGAKATRARVASRASGVAQVPVAASLRGRLRNRSEVRRAIVMSEILSPPVALR